MKKGKIKVEPCRWCGKLTNTFYITADDLENPKPYHRRCTKKLLIKVLTDELDNSKTEVEDLFLPYQQK